MVHGEFQVVILAAGRGSRMTDLTSDTPKCLLPVGGSPILCHTIRTLEKSGFHDAIIVVLEDESIEIQKALIHNNVKINYELINVSSDSEDWGTADSLRYLISQDKIKNDIVLVTCDLFTNSRINNLLHTYRQHKASFAALFFLPIQCESFQVPGLKSKNKPEKDIIGIDLDTSRLLFLASVSDFEENVSISKNILRHHPRLNLRTDLVDGHFYVLSYSLTKYLAVETVFGTLKGEFFPHIVSKQHVRKNLGNEESSVMNDSVKKNVSDFMKETTLEEKIIEFSTFNDHDGDLKKAYHGDVLKCYAVIADDKEFGIRINSLQALCQANKLCTSEDKLENDFIGTRINSSAIIESNQVDSLSFIGEFSKISEKTSIKSTVMGENCTIKPKTRVSQCIILNNVEVKEGCILDNCIVANDSKIGNGCDLKNCLIGANFIVPDGTKANSQVLTKSEALMEI